MPVAGLPFSGFTGFDIEGATVGGRLLLLWAKQEGDMPPFGIQVVIWV